MRKTLMHFTAKWCGPCKAMQPIIEKFLQENPQLEYIPIDIDLQPELTKDYNVMSVPTFISLVDDKQYTSRIGAMPLAQLRKLFPEGDQEVFKTSNMESAPIAETDAMGREMFWKDAGRPLD